ncbi:unnamed protein product [Linum tenue]|uniref:Uncharacterized protein n=1 Tax=Linum tenue TaxID=586396 RepID=A0AAV0GRW3_9ROSI|nr:unnamed protein product [Linum tenue]
MFTGETRSLWRLLTIAHIT